MHCIAYNSPGVSRPQHRNVSSTISLPAKFTHSIDKSSFLCAPEKVTLLLLHCWWLGKNTFDCSDSLSNGPGHARWGDELSLEVWLIVTAKAKNFSDVCPIPRTNGSPQLPVFMHGNLLPCLGCCMPTYLYPRIASHRNVQFSLINYRLQFAFLQNRHGSMVNRIFCQMYQIFNNNEIQPQQLSPFASGVLRNFHHCLRLQSTQLKYDWIS